MSEINTVGDLRRLLAEFGDDDPLIIEDEGDLFRIDQVTDRGPDEHGRKLAHIRVSPSRHGF